MHLSRRGSAARPTAGAPDASSRRTLPNHIINRLAQPYIFILGCAESALQLFIFGPRIAQMVFCSVTLTSESIKCGTTAPVFFFGAALLEPQPFVFALEYLQSHTKRQSQAVHSAVTRSYRDKLSGTASNTPIHSHKPRRTILAASGSFGLVKQQRTAAGAHAFVRPDKWVYPVACGDMCGRGDGHSRIGVSCNFGWRIHGSD
jgi:hypothetical protein